MSWYDGEKGPDAIEPDKLRDGELYRIYARGGNVGICRRERMQTVFEIARFKHGGYRLDTEIEWESSERHGTAYATKHLEEVPGEVLMAGEDVRLAYLIDAEHKLALDDLELAGKNLSKAQREKHFALGRVLSFLDHFTPKGTFRGVRGCEKSLKLTVCCYPLEGVKPCVFCGREREDEQGN